MFVAPAPQINGEQLANRHIFGSIPAAATATPVNAASAVHVIGIVSISEPGQSWALLDINGNQKSFASGDILPDGEKLVSIKADRVTLEQNGNRYSILLDIHAADMNARFDTFNVGTLNVGEFDSLDSIAIRPFIPPPPTEQSLEALRQQLLARRAPMQPREPIAPPSKPPAPPL